MRISGPMIIIPPQLLPAGEASSEQEVDLTLYQGGIARVYLTAQGQAVVNPTIDCWWQVAEVNLPPPRMEQVQVGTEVIETGALVFVIRGDGSSDTILIAQNQHIGRVGPEANPYAPGTEYTVSAGEILWTTGPATGDSYLVEIVTAIESPVYESTLVPLDLAEHNVIFMEAYHG